ncbi:hypothetical protein SASPL_154868 [Salvia splendens]|uniref:Glyoxal oxidase N-terminal domain-containing protein n=1 Tax=Salvia splendens TaxID=180675 RepID=A0A8X8W130_SALSN|nr:hypothetical protein SASPL_154868 [Salvia splendens]
MPRGELLRLGGIPHALSERRWYASNQILPDGRIIIVGGRAQHNYEFYPGDSRSIKLDFLRQTKDGYENNLYPFLHLLPDGNLFIFANRQSIVLDYKQDRVVRQLPAITGGDSRNYPSSGSCFCCLWKRISLRWRRRVTDDQPVWGMAKMPSARVMSDMLLLPNGDVIIINGAKSGAEGWEAGRNPVTTPHIYRPDAPADKRFTSAAASPRPRMYHSTTILLANGRVLVGGSNPHIY